MRLFSTYKLKLFKFFPYAVLSCLTIFLSYALTTNILGLCVTYMCDVYLTPSQMQVLYFVYSSFSL